MKLAGPWEEKCLYITVTLGPFESKVFTHYNRCWGPLWKQSKILYEGIINFSQKWGIFTREVRGGERLKGGVGRCKCLACLPLNTPLYITLAMILCENTKPIEHALLHSICVLSHLLCSCKHCNVVFFNRGSTEPKGSASACQQCQMRL